MKTQDIAILGAVAVVGYGLINSDFFKGVGGGVGSAVGGVGGGVGYAGQSAGYNLADIFGAFGQLGKSSTTIIKEGGHFTTDTIHHLRDVQDEGAKDTKEIVDKGGDIFVDVANIGSDTSGTLRGIWKGGMNALDYTWNLDEPTNVFSGIGRGVGGVFNWVKSQVSTDDKSLKTDKTPQMSSLITGKITAPISSGGGSSSGGGGGGSVKTPTRSLFMEQLGYEGTTTQEGIEYNKPAPEYTFTPAPVQETIETEPEKKWWNPFD